MSQRAFHRLAVLGLVGFISSGTRDARQHRREMSASDSVAGVIVQSAAPDGSHLVLTMEEHTATGAVLAQHFGGTTLFDRPHPRDLFVDLVAEHDRGWVPIDEAAPRDPSTDLPWTVYDAPVVHTLTAGLGTIEYNAGCHPYRGLMASMHIAGLFNGRFGMNDPMPVDRLDHEDADRLVQFLETEQTRRERLLRRLGGDPETAGWVDQHVLMKSYKALQFFDRLALWLQVTHPANRHSGRFSHVPGRDTDLEVDVEQVDEVRVSVDPFPFDDELPIVITGRRLRSQPASIDLATALRSAPPDRQHVLLCA